MDAAAAMVTPGYVLADIGTDHGYIPIALVREQKIPRAIAMDLRKGPLERASEHIHRFGLEDYIETRLSDGTEALQPGEADTILIAGMGGGLTIHILEAGEAVCRTAKELILQPQSELERVRHFLRKNGYPIVAEDMVFEDGKYYPMMKVVPKQQCAAGQNPLEDVLAQAQISDMPWRISDQYGPLLLAEGHPVLESYLSWQMKQLGTVLERLKEQLQSEQIQERIVEVEAAMADNQLARKIVADRICKDARQI